MSGADHFELRVLFNMVLRWGHPCRDKAPLRFEFAARWRKNETSRRAPLSILPALQVSTGRSGVFYMFDHFPNKSWYRVHPLNARSVEADTLIAVRLQRTVIECRIRRRR